MVQTKRKAASVSSAASADDHEKNGTTRSKRQKASTWVKSDDDNDNDDDKDNDEHAEADGIAAGMSVPYGNTTDQKFDTAIDPANTKDNAQSTNGEAISGADDLNGEDNKISPGSEEENSQDAVKPSEKASFETQVKSEIVDEPKAENSSKSQPDSVPSIAPINEEEEEEIETLDEEEKKRIHTYNFDGYMYTYKDRPSVIEEQEGKIEFRVVNNDNSRDNMIVLTGLKNIFQKQLPEMPKAYIARLVYDRSHVSIAVVREPLTVVGGITIRPFETHEFAEIVFCAISSTEQVRGYGAHLMNHLKDYVLNTTKIKYFLTYADNYAIGYFKKQGFTKEITLPKKVWMGYIKDYEGGTLMQCTMLSGIRYLDSPKILSIQKAAILRKIRSIGKSHIVRKGLDHFKKEGFTPLNPFDIPGVKEAGWTREMDDLAQKPKRGPHYIAMLTIFTEMQNHPSNWPFMQPVSKTEVPDYYEVIKEPMDLSTMEVKLENDAYETMDDFIYDCKLIFNNCRQYNGENTTFYKNANKLEKSVIAKLKDFPEYSACLDILTKR